MTGKCKTCGRFIDSYGNCMSCLDKEDAQREAEQMEGFAL